MRAIMQQADLSAKVNLDTLLKKNLYGLGPVAGLKGELMILDGEVYTSSKNGDQVENLRNKVSEAAMLVYCHVNKWRTVSIKASVNGYHELEELISKTAVANGYDISVPFAFKIEVLPVTINYHVINWQEGVAHTSDNHKQFAYSGQFTNQRTTLLGFYSTQHKGIFTHHTSSMHIHFLNNETSLVGHLDDIQINDSITLYLPEK